MIFNLNIYKIVHYIDYYIYSLSYALQISIAVLLKTKRKKERKNIHYTFPSIVLTKSPSRHAIFSKLV